MFQKTSCSPLFSRQLTRLVNGLVFSHHYNVDSKHFGVIEKMQIYKTVHVMAGTAPSTQAFIGQNSCARPIPSPNLRGQYDMTMENCGNFITPGATTWT